MREIDPEKSLEKLVAVTRDLDILSWWTGKAGLNSIVPG